MPNDMASPTTLDEAVANFCAVTGADDETAHHYLAAAGNDVEVAVGLFLDGTSLEGRAVTSSSTGGVINPPSLDEVRAPIQPRRTVLVSETEAYSAGQYSRAAPSMFPPTEPFRDFRTEANIPFLGQGATDERGRRLAELFRPPTELMFKGGFDAARRQARMEKRWLLVTVHNPTEFPCQMMVRDVWNDAAIQDFIRESLVFLLITVGTSEAERYQQYYKFNEFPHWALIDPRTGKRVRSGNRVIRAPEMLMELVEYVSDHPLGIAHKHDSPADLDREKIEGSYEIDEDVTRPAINLPNPLVESPVDKRCVSLMHAPATVMIPPEPPLDNPESLTIQIRLPSGSRHRRRFLRNEKIQVLFDFVHSICAELEEFDIQVHTLSLSPHRSDTLEKHNLKNAALTVILKDYQ